MEEHNKNIVCDLYKALATGDTTMVQRLLAPNIGWWFHGPPANKCNLMRMLTGGFTSCDNVSFEPLSIVGIGSMVLAEGYHVYQNRKTYWVHAWTVDNGKIITEVKEYLNASVIVTRVKKSDNVDLASPRSPRFKKMWQSKLAYKAYVPRLVLVL